MTDINSGLVGHWKLDNVFNNKVVDSSGNGYNGQQEGTVIINNNNFGKSLQFNGIDGTIDLTASVGTDYDNLTTLSIAAWINPKNLPTFSGIVGQSGVNSLFHFQINSLKSQLYIYSTVSGGGTGSTVVLTNNWQHVTGTWNGTSGSISLYLNGSFDGITTGVTGVLDNIGSNSLRIGNSFGTRYFNGNIKDVRIYNRVLTTNEISELYNQGKHAGFRGNYGVVDSTTEEIGIAHKYLSNTPWKFRDTTGGFKISTEFIGTERCKIIECTTTGILYLDTQTLNQSKTDAAYGTWEFWVNKTDDASEMNIMFIADIIGTYNTAGQNGYLFQFNSTEKFTLYACNSASPVSMMISANTAGQLNRWYKIKITRSSIGIFYVYVDDELLSLVGGSGTNPSTHTTHTKSNYICLAFNAGDKIAFASENGNIGFFKGLFA